MMPSLPPQGRVRARWYPVPTAGVRDLTASQGVPLSQSPYATAPLNGSARCPKSTISPAMVRGLCQSSPASSPGG